MGELTSRRLYAGGDKTSSVALSKGSGMSELRTAFWGVGVHGVARRRGACLCLGAARRPRPVHHLLQRHPAAPQHQPARFAVALAILMTPQTRQCQEELAHTQRSLL